MAKPRSSTLTRAIDRWLGIPLLLAMGARRSFVRRRAPASPRRIGLLKTAGIGDMVLVSAIVRDIAQIPEASITVFAGQENAGAARLISGVDRVVALDLARPLNAVRAMRSSPLDLLIDFGSWPRVDALLATVSTAAYTLGFRTHRQHRHYAFDRVVEHSDQVHELENYRNLLRAMSLDACSMPAIDATEKLPPSLIPEGRYCVCHLWPGGHRSRLREWPLDRWRAVIANLVGSGLRVVLTGGPADAAATRDFHATLGEDGALVIVGAGRYPLGILPDLLRRSALVVSVNTGIMHMAAALNVPTISLNGPTAEHRWGPVGDCAVSVNSRLPGSGFLNLGWEYEGQREDAMLGIAVSDVLDSIQRSIGPARSGAPRARRTLSAAS